jgi:phage repressor protein C with HTH and peptisase S24 domain
MDQELNINEIRLQNFLYHIKNTFDGSVNLFAKKHKINVNQYYAIIRGERTFGEKTARKIERLLELESGELDLYGKNITESLNKTIRLYNMTNRYSSIKEFFTSKDTQLISYTTSFLKLNNVNQYNLIAIRQADTSMQPIINRASIALIDIDKNGVVDGELRLVMVRGVLYIREIHRLVLTNEYELRSANDKYKDIIISWNELTVIGQPIFVFNTL